MSHSKAHETFARPDVVIMRSDHGLSNIFGCFFGVIAAVQLWGGAPAWTLVSLALSAAMFAIALIAPRMLRPLSIAWFKLAPLLHKVVIPIIMGLLFFLVVMPIDLLMRAFGKRPLSLRFDPVAQSHWLVPTPLGSKPGTSQSKV